MCSRYGINYSFVLRDLPQGQWPCDRNVSQAPSRKCHASTAVSQKRVYFVTTRVSGHGCVD